MVHGRRTCVHHGHPAASNQRRSGQARNSNRGVQIGIVTIDGNGNLTTEKLTIQKQLERYTQNRYGNNLGAQLVKAADMKALADGCGLASSELEISLGFNEQLRADVARLKEKLHDALLQLGQAEDEIRQAEDREQRLQSASVVNLFRH